MHVMGVATKFLRFTFRVLCYHLVTYIFGLGFNMFKVTYACFFIQSYFYVLFSLSFLSMPFDIDAWQV